MTIHESQKADQMEDEKDGRDELRDALSELKNLDDDGSTVERKEPKVVEERVSEKPPAPPSQRQMKKEGAAKVKKTGRKYDELRKRPSMKALKNEDMETLEKLSDVAAPVNVAIKLIQDFEKKYALMIDRNKIGSYRSQLREISSVMLAEVYALRHGKQKKVYDESKICKVCHSVFMVSLPKDRICDACRSQIRDTDK